jgi:hypothetical protein
LKTIISSENNVPTECLPMLLSVLQPHATRSSLVPAYLPTWVSSPTTVIDLYPSIKYISSTFRSTEICCGGCAGAGKCDRDGLSHRCIDTTQQPLYICLTSPEAPPRSQLKMFSIRHTDSRPCAVAVSRAPGYSLDSLPNHRISQSTS